MKALELSDILKEFAVIYPDVDVCFLVYDDVYGAVDISIDTVRFVNGLILLDYRDVDISKEDVELMYNGEWLDGETSRD